MKLLLLLLVFMLSGWTGEPDCEAFYKETLAPMSVKGELIKKEQTDKYYLLYVKNEKDNGKEATIRLLKNQTGKKIFLFAKDKSIIVKVKGEVIVRVLAPLGDGGLRVQQFPELCE